MTAAVSASAAQSSLSRASPTKNCVPSTPPGWPPPAAPGRAVDVAAPVGPEMEQEGGGGAAGAEVGDHGVEGARRSEEADPLPRAKQAQLCERHLHPAAKHQRCELLSPLAGRASIASERQMYRPAAAAAAAAAASP